MCVCGTHPNWCLIIACGMEQRRPDYLPKDLREGLRVFLVCSSFSSPVFPREEKSDSSQGKSFLSSPKKVGVPLHILTHTRMEMTHELFDISFPCYAVRPQCPEILFNIC